MEYGSLLKFRGSLVSALSTCCIFHFVSSIGATLMTQLVKNLLAMQETWVPSLHWEDPLEEGTATHSSILAWRIPMDRGAWQATVHGVMTSWTLQFVDYPHAVFSTLSQILQ